MNKMNRLKTISLVTGTLTAILALGGGYCVHYFLKPTEIQPDPVALQQENCELKQRNSDLEDEAIAYEFETLAYTEAVDNQITGLELEIQGLKECKSGLARKVSELRVMNDEQDVKVDDLTIKDAKSQRKLKKLYSNSAINQDYPAEAIEQLMDGAKVTYDKKRFEDAVGRFNPLGRQSFFMAFLDEGQLYSSYDSRKRDRYDEFFRNVLTTEEKSRILNTLGIRSNSLNQRYSPLSLAVFEVYENTKNSIQLPPVR